MPLLNPEQNEQETVKESPIVKLANGMVIKQNEFADFELWRDGKLLGTYRHPDGVWAKYREMAFSEGDEIALHGLGVTLGKELPSPKVEKLPWEIHAIV